MMLVKTLYILIRDINLEIEMRISSPYVYNRSIACIFVSIRTPQKPNNDDQKIFVRFEKNRMKTYIKIDI